MPKKLISRGGASFLPWSKSSSSSSSYVDALRNSMTGESLMMLVIMLVVIAIVLIILYIVYLIKTGSTQTSSLSGDVVNMNAAAKDPNHNPTTATVKMLRDQAYQYGVSLWLYVGAATTDKGVIAYFGPTVTAASMSAASVAFLFDGARNVLVAKVATQQSGGSMSRSIDDDTDNSVQLKMTYVPRQRWVHLAVSVRDTVATLYVDGDIYTVMTVYDKGADSGARFADLFDTNGSTTGNLGSSTDLLDAYLANGRVYNYAPIQTDVAAQYSAGPYTQSWLAWLGLGKYKLRSPVCETGSENC